MSEQTKNVMIASTYLGIEDHGILTFIIHVKGDGWTQGFGGFGCTVVACNSFLADSVKAILETLEIRSWEDLPGTIVRVVESQGRLTKIGHAIKDKWYDIDEDSRRYC